MRWLYVSLVNRDFVSAIFLLIVESTSKEERGEMLEESTFESVCSCVCVCVCVYASMVCECKLEEFWLHYAIMI